METFNREKHSAVEHTWKLVSCSSDTPIEVSVDFIAINNILMFQSKSCKLQSKGQPHPAHVACEVRMVFIFINDLRKPSKQRRMCVGDYMWASKPEILTLWLL